MSKVQGDLLDQVIRLEQLHKGQRYLELLSEANRLVEVARQQHQARVKAIGLRFRALALQGLARWYDAAQEWEKAGHAWRELKDTTATVESLLQQAYCQRRSGVLAQDPAIPNLIDAAIRIAQSETADGDSVAQILREASLQWQHLHEFQIAHTLAHAALAVYQRRGSEPSAQAQILAQLADIENYRGNRQRELDYHLQTLNILEQRCENCPEIPAILLKLGDILTLWGNPEEARYYYWCAALLSEQLQDTPRVAEALYHLGRTALSQGNRKDAVHILTRSLRLHEQLDPYSAPLVACLAELEFAILGSVQLQESRLYGRALQILHSGCVDPRQRAAILSSISRMAGRREDWDTACRLLEQAHEALESLQSTPLEKADNLHALSVAERQANRLQRAQSHAAKALHLYETINPQALRVAAVLDNLARITYMAWETQRNPALLEDALRHFQRAAEILQRVRNDIHCPERRVAFGERYFEIYHWLALVYLQQRRPHQAVEALEQGRARVLAEMLQWRQAARRSSAESQPLKAVLQMCHQRQSVYRRLHHAYSHPQGDSASTTRAVRQLLRELNQLDLALAQYIPQMPSRTAAQFRYRPPTIRTIQSNLSADTVLLYHATLENRLLLIAVSPTEVRGRVQSVNTPLQKDALRFASRLAQPKRRAHEPEEIHQQAAKLYNTLVRPVLPKPPKRVLLCPGGDLSQLPWGALVTSWQRGAPVYWVQQSILHLTPSMGVYLQLRQMNHAREGAAIIAVAQHRAMNPPSEGGKIYEDLPGVETEVRRLKQNFRAATRFAIESRATPTYARAIIQNQRVVHIATHTHPDPLNPANLALKLAPAAQEDGLLTADEIMQTWNLQADLVMLSACDTAQGTVYKYEGIQSLARAFLYAGAQSVGASLWKVADSSTADLMEQFYQTYWQGNPKDTALQQAQQKLLSRPETADPYHWAGFTLIGYFT